MPKTDMPTDDELTSSILEVIRENDTCGSVNLGSFIFDRIPCSRRKLYRLAAKNAEVWGYSYNKAEYVPSGNRPFQRNHRRGQHRSPYLTRVRTN